MAIDWTMLIAVFALLAWVFRKEKPKEAASRTWGLSRPVWLLVAGFCAFLECAGAFATGGRVNGWGDVVSCVVLAAVGLVAVVNAIRPPGQRA